MISKVEIENFKSFDKVSVELGKFNVLIGPNNSGKSSFCSAIELLHRLSIFPGGDTVFSGRYNTSQLLRNVNGQINITVNLSLLESNYKYALCLSKRKPYFDLELLKRKNQNLIERSSNHLKFIDQPNFNWSMHDWNNSIFFELRTEYEEFHIVRSFLQLIQSFRFIPSAIHQPAYLKDASQPQIFESGFGLPAVLDFLLHKKLKSYMDIVEKMRAKFKDIDEIILEPTMVPERDFHDTEKRFEITNYQGSRLIFKLKGRDDFVESPHISDGVIYYLLFLTILNQAKNYYTMIIEEPENGIHPSNLKEIIGHIRQLSEEKECQVILTTHSPYLLDWVKKEEVLIFHRDNDGPTQITRMSDIPDIDDLLKGYLLGELWANYGEERLLKGKIDEED